jgi:hypothetical protein
VNASIAPHSLLRLCPTAVWTASAGSLIFPEKAFDRWRIPPRSPENFLPYDEITIRLSLAEHAWRCPMSKSSGARKPPKQTLSIVQAFLQQMQDRAHADRPLYRGGWTYVENWHVQSQSGSIHNERG